MLHIVFVNSMCCISKLNYMSTLVLLTLLLTCSSCQIFWHELHLLNTFSHERVSPFINMFSDTI